MLKFGNLVLRKIFSRKSNNKEFSVGENFLLNQNSLLKNLAKKIFEVGKAE